MSFHMLKFQFINEACEACEASAIWSGPFPAACLPT